MHTILKDVILLMIVVGSIVFIHRLNRRFGIIARIHAAGQNPSRLVWALLIPSLLGNILIGLCLLNLSDESSTADSSLRARIAALEERVPDSVRMTSMLEDPRVYPDLSTRLALDFGVVSRRLEDLEKEPALALYPAEVALLRENYRELGHVVILASVNDTDWDGVEDAYDDWPTIPRDQDHLDPTASDGGRSAAFWSSGVPAIDTDDDLISDAVDACPSEAGTDYDLNTVGGIPQHGETLSKSIPVAFYGCPDSDEDLIPDAVDLCLTAKAEGDENFDGCEDATQDLRTEGDHRWGTGPVYDDVSGKLVGYFKAERNVGDMLIEFTVACEALDKAGKQMAPWTANKKPKAKSWGVCRPVGGV